MDAGEVPVANAGVVFKRAMDGREGNRLGDDLGLARVFNRDATRRWRDRVVPLENRTDAGGHCRRASAIAPASKTPEH